MVADPAPMASTAGTLLSRAAHRLAAAGVASPEVDARLLLAHVLGARPVRPDRVATGGQAAAFERLVARRAAREPLQLITGTTGFHDLDLVCQPGVFVPRPETEVVAGLAIDAARAAGPRPVVVEPCTGTGAIALAVAAAVPGAVVVATDDSRAAVAAAERNLARLRAGSAGTPGLAAGTTVTVHRGALLEPVDRRLAGRVDVLVANPPYLPAADRSTWDPEVADHDPHDALIGGPDGHEVVDHLLALAPTWLRPGGTAVVEIDARRGSDAIAAARAAGLTGVRVARDLTGADRVLVATTASAPITDLGRSR